ncbi:MAG: transposase [Rubrobacteraceae bacterium]|nr:transposase [Rubrobacteraceae bacterium]
MAEVAARARKTNRLEEALLAIVLELGGRARARLAAELGLLAGRDALLSRAKRAAPARAGEVKVLGIEDFAFRRGALPDLKERGGAVRAPRREALRGAEGVPEEAALADEALADAHRLSQDFAAMVRDLEGEKLDEWLDEAEACEAPAMRNFAVGLKKDLDAVRAGLTEEWSNGPVEGFVNKLKLVKHQGYGRAGFELLRARMLAA